MDMRQQQHEGRGLVVAVVGDFYRQRVGGSSLACGIRSGLGCHIGLQNDRHFRTCRSVTRFLLVTDGHNGSHKPPVMTRILTLLFLKVLISTSIYHNKAN